MDAHPPVRIGKSVVAAKRDAQAATAEEHRAREARVRHHLSAFDLNGDGVVDVWETVACLCRMGLSAFLALPAALVLHALLSWPAQPGWTPDPLLGIPVAGAARLHFGSSAGVYGGQKAFRDAFPGECARAGVGLGDVVFMRGAAYDPAGWIASRLLWVLLWALCADSDSRCIPWATVERVADGTLYRDLMSADGAGG